ncbi:MAG: sugar porter family MFS transporter [Planctomycetota bacterium]|jgi:sugar porter (SP) family MFS transporter
MDYNNPAQTTSNSTKTRYVSSVCVVAALGGLLFGYDTAVISGAIGFLQTRFGLDPKWTGWAASCALVGCIMGVSIAGILSDRLGRKKVLFISAALFLISAVGTALPRNLTEFIIFRVIGGIGVGAASMTSPMYIAEISPARIRGRMVSVNQFAIIFGMLVVYFVNYFIARSGTEQWNIQYGWRWMFGSEAIPAILLLMLLFLVPESPRWLTKQGRTEEALRILSRIRDSERAQAELVEIKDAIAHESGSITQLLQPRMRIVLLIGVALAILQQVTGINVFLYYAPEIFKELGTGTNAALLQTVIVGAVNLTFTIVAIWTVDLLGRKPLMILGVAGMGVSLFAMGFAAYLQKTELWVLVFILAYIASFALSVGPVTWVILSEIFPTSIRGRAMAIATFWLWSANYVVSQTFPMMNKNKWLVDKFHHGFPFWVYGALCVVELVFVLFMLPETKGKTLEQIEKHWMKWK